MPYVPRLLPSEPDLTPKMFWCSQSVASGGGSGSPPSRMQLCATTTASLPPSPQVLAEAEAVYAEAASPEKAESRV